MSASRMILCRDCTERIHMYNYVTELGMLAAEDECQLCGKKTQLWLIEYENREAADRRNAIRRKKTQPPKKDTRARWREPWREW